MIVMEMFIGYCMVYYSTQKSNANSLSLALEIKHSIVRDSVIPNKESYTIMILRFSIISS